MMGQQLRTGSLFYYFRLEDQIPEDHLLRLIDQHIDLSFVRERLKNFYSWTGRPSIDPEVLLRLLLVGYLYGITSERRLLEEVRMHLAYRWFTRLDFEQEIPDHSTFSKNRHGRFRQSGVFREVFEEIVRRCLEAGLVAGKNLAVDGTLVRADASRQSRVRREQLKEAARISRTVQEYLAELEEMNPVPEAEMVSATDPDAILTTKGGGTAVMAYYDNYLIDTASRVILGVEATPALFHQETVAARRMLERVKKLGVQPESLGADKAYGSGEFLAWLLAQVCNRIFRSSIVAIRRMGVSRVTAFVMNLRRMPTTARKGKRFAIAVCNALVKGTPIAQRKRSAKAVPRRNIARPLPIASSSCTGTNRPGRRYAHWPEHQPMNVRGGLAIRSKLCLPNSSSACVSGGCDYAACGMSGSSSCWRQPRRT